MTKHTLQQRAFAHLHEALLAASDVEPRPPVIKPNPGPQEQFVYSDADITIYGGAAGGGKSWGLMLRATRYLHVPGFAAVIFRRKTSEIRQTGGLLTTSMEVFPLLKGSYRENTMEWRFPAGSYAKLSHMEHPSNRLDWSGSQIPEIGFDELQSFEEEQFWFLISRNRSTCGVRPHVMATCNPDPDSFVAKLIAWWIDQDTGYAIPERSGVKRWFLRDHEGNILWGNSREDLAPHMEEFKRDPISLVFISSKLSDNPPLEKSDPKYRSMLQAMPLIDRQRLLDGNWKVRPAAGAFWNRGMFEDRIVEKAPEGSGFDIRGWDKAASLEMNRDRTASVKIRRGLADGNIYVLDATAFRATAADREDRIKDIAVMDGKQTKVFIEQEPGSGGKESAEATINNLSGIASVTARYSTGHKTARWRGIISQCERGKVFLVRGPWNKEFVDELHNADGSNNVHDDFASAFEIAYYGLLNNLSRGIF